MRFNSQTWVERGMNIYKTSLYSSLFYCRGVGGVTSKAVPMATYRWFTSRWCSCRDNLQCVASLWELSEMEEHIVGVCCRGCSSITPQSEQLMRHRKQDWLKRSEDWGLTLNWKQVWDCVEKWTEVTSASNLCLNGIYIPGRGGKKNICPGSLKLNSSFWIHLSHC